MRPTIFGGMIALVFLCVSCSGPSLHVDTPHSGNGSFDNVLDSVVALVEPTPTGLRGPTCTAFFVSETDIVTAGHCILEVSMRLEVTPRGFRIVVSFEEPHLAIGREIHFITREQYNAWVGTAEDDRPDHPEYSSATVLSVMGPHQAGGAEEGDDNDVALLRVSTRSARSSNWLRVRNRQESPPEVGENAYAVGLPVGEPWILTRGIISRIHIGLDNLIQVFHDARIGHGSSGGPVLDERARVVGINVQISRENIFSKATPGSTIQTLYSLYESRLEIEALDRQFEESQE